MIRIGNDPNRNNDICGTVSSEQRENGPQITLSCDISGRYLSVEIAGYVLTLCEVKIFGKPYLSKYCF